MPSYRYRVVDVFTKEALAGNALAVFLDAVTLDTATMQKIAREINLAETTFVLPPTRKDCTARVRIFTPVEEMVFAGHPTLGTAYVLAAESQLPWGQMRFQLEEKVGAVPVRIEPGERPRFWLTTPAIVEGREAEGEACARALGVGVEDLLGPAPQMLSAGNPNLYVALRSKDAVDRAFLDLAGLRGLKQPGDGLFCVFVFAPVEGGVYARMFAPEHGIVEDPATGSATGPLAVYLRKHGLVTGDEFVSEQGVKMGRRSLLYVRVEGERIEVGGYVTAVAEAVLTL
jgi:trans-2,3-dihydro-3-hydroxyanthranilate isomerase